MKRIFLPLVVTLSFAGLALSGCAAVLATGAGGALGVSAAQEGGLNRAYNDAKIQTQINDLWFRHDTDMFRKLDLTVNKGRVLITGVVQNPEHRVEAVRLAWQPKGVEQVINEIRVAKSDGITGFARDSWISARLRTTIAFDKAIQSINYTIDTVQGTVYLMGVAQDQRELDAVVQTARRIPDVKRVVSYVKLAGEQEDTYREISGGSDTQAQSRMDDRGQAGYEANQMQPASGISSTPSSLNAQSDMQPAPVDEWGTQSGGPITLYPVESAPIAPMPAEPAGQPYNEYEDNSQWQDNQW